MFASLKIKSDCQPPFPFGLAYLHQTKVARVQFRSGSGTFPPNLNLNHSSQENQFCKVQFRSKLVLNHCQHKKKGQHISSMPNFAHAMPLAVSDLMWKAAITS